MKNYSGDALKMIQRSLNWRSRKTLGYKIPDEKIIAVVVLSS
ncbi:unnamed protein product [Acidithrix sp. C25]|nr:unnamed protein product [Acidithrix sp. C25]